MVDALQQLDSNTAAGQWLRVEDAALTTGAGCYVSDITLPDMWFGAFVRSPYALATFTTIQIRAAQAASGVKAVLTAAQLSGLPMPMVNPLKPKVTALSRPLFAVDAVHFVGEPVALVVAQTQEQARAAAELVSVNWVELQGTADHAEDVAPYFEVHWQTAGYNPAPEQIYSTDEIQVGFNQPRVAAQPLEPRSAVADWAPATGHLQMWLPTQTPFRARVDLSTALGIALEKIRVVAPDIGGAFGARASIYPEDIILAAAARYLQHAVKWLGTRSEEFLASSHGRGCSADLTAFLGADEKLARMKVQFDFPLGAWLPFSAVVPARNAARMMPGLYNIPQVSAIGRGHLSNTSPMNIYRGAGRPEACMALERLMDKAAHVVEQDPLDFRRRHLLAAEQFPHTLPSGAVIDSANPAQLLDRAETLFAYRAARQMQQQRREAGQLVGIGIALYVEPCGEGWEHVQIEWKPIIDSDPIYSDSIYVTVTTGSTAQGQGRKTQVTQLTSQWLGVDAQHILVCCGDTNQSDDGIGALASRSTAIGASALFEACERMKALRQTQPTGPWLVKHRYTAAAEAWSSGCVMTQVAVNPDTGELTTEKLVWVDDAGTILNPVLAKGQLMGGLAQGLGQALCEQIVYDDQGQLITGSFMDYALLRADQIPVLILESINTPTKANRLSAKGVGEAGCIGVPAALLNAAEDALSTRGFFSLELPLTSSNLWEALNDKVNTW